MNIGKLFEKQNPTDFATHNKKILRFVQSNQRRLPLYFKDTAKMGERTRKWINIYKQGYLDGIDKKHGDNSLNKIFDTGVTCGKYCTQQAICDELKDINEYLKEPMYSRCEVIEMFDTLAEIIRKDI